MIKLTGNEIHAAGVPHLDKAEHLRKGLAFSMGELKPHLSVLLFPEYRALKVIADGIDHLLIRTVRKWWVREI